MANEKKKKFNWWIFKIWTNFGTRLARMNPLMILWCLPKVESGAVSFWKFKPVVILMKQSRRPVRLYNII